MKEKPLKSKKINIKDSNEIPEKVDALNKILFEKPQICFIDIENKIKDNLMERGFNIQSGTLGKGVIVPNTNDYLDKGYKCRANYFFPENLHEFDIIVLDLKPKELIPYNATEHVKEYVEESSDYFFFSQSPETLFNPKPYGSYILGNEIAEITSHPLILIVFADEYITYSYKLAKQSYNGVEIVDKIKYNNYQMLHHFCPEILYPIENKTGKEFNVQKEFGSKFSEFLNKYIVEALYNVVFKNPQINNGLENYRPLIKNSHSETVSFLRTIKNHIVFVFPQIKDKNSFLCELFTNHLITLCPYMFPSYMEFKWLEETAYMLPNHKHLLELKETTKKEYEEKIGRLDKEIENNHEKYKCLHYLLTKTGNELVKSVKTFLEWLGFENVKIMDDENESPEEDLQIQINEGLLVIEITGIEGTSTDDKCSQIGKIRNRRQEERHNTDVFALYIVNHQRHQPPLRRENPPFKEHQIKDAVIDNRGLLTTWQLYNLYTSIRNGVISKDEARKALIKPGLIEFRPQNCISLGKPVDFLSKKKVIILDLHHKIETNDELIVKRKNEFSHKTKILEIRMNNERIESANCGTVGIQVDIDIKDSDELFLKDDSLSEQEFSEI